MKITVNDKGNIENTAPDNAGEYTADGSAFSGSREVGDVLNFVGTHDRLTSSLNSLEFSTSNIEDTETRESVLKDISEVRAVVDDELDTRKLAKQVSNGREDSDVDVSELAAQYINSNGLARSVVSVNIMTGVHEGKPLANSTARFDNIIEGVEDRINSIRGDIEAVLDAEGFYDDDDEVEAWDEWDDEDEEWDEWNDDFYDDDDEDWLDESESDSIIESLGGLLGVIRDSIGEYVGETADVPQDDEPEADDEDPTSALRDLLENMAGTGESDEPEENDDPLAALRDLINGVDQDDEPEETVSEDEDSFPLTRRLADAIGIDLDEVISSFADDEPEEEEDEPEEESFGDRLRDVNYLRDVLGLKDDSPVDRDEDGKKRKVLRLGGLTIRFEG